MARKIDLSDFLPADLVEFRPARAQRWLVGYVVAVAMWFITIRRAPGGAVFTVEPGADGEIRKLAGRRLIRVQERLTQRPRQTLRPCRAEEDTTPEHAGPPPASRIVHRGAAPLSSCPRRPARRQSYLRFVRSRPCCACWAPAPSEAHHFGPHGTGQKCDDYQTVPLCGSCHREITDRYTVPGHTRGEAEVLFLRTALTLLIDWTLHREEGRPLPEVEPPMDLLSEEERSHVA